MKRLVTLLIVLAAIVVYDAAHAGPRYVTQADSSYNAVRISTGVAFADSVVVDTISVGTVDSSRIIDGRGYDDIEVELFSWPVADTCSNVWTKYGVRIENNLVGNVRVARVADSLANSVRLDEPDFGRSGRGSLTGDSLTFENVPVGSPNMVQGRARPGEVQVYVGTPRLWNNFSGTSHSGVSFFMPRRTGGLRFFRLYVRALAQSCYHSSHVASRVYARVYLYRKTDRARF